MLVLEWLASSIAAVAVAAVEVGVVAAAVGVVVVESSAAAVEIAFFGAAFVELSADVALVAGVDVALVVVVDVALVAVAAVALVAGFAGGVAGFVPLLSWTFVYVRMLQTSAW